MSGPTDGGRPRVAPPPLPSDIGVVAALPIEVARLIADLRDSRKYTSERHTIHEGFCQDRLVSVIVTGPGRTAAARGAQLLITGHRPRWLLSVGFAGALDPELRRNDLIIPARVLSTTEDAFRIDPNLDPSDSSQPPRTLITVEHIVRTADDKARLRESSGADAVDMETHAVAGVAAQRGLRFLSVRVISDTAHVDLPPEVLSLVGPTGGYRVGAAIGAVWKRPSSVIDMLELRENALQAAGVLATAFPTIVKKLPP